MGLSTTHDCFDGSYIFFNDMRSAISVAAGYGDYRDMCEENNFPENDILNELFDHSDCDGILKWEICESLADRLLEVHPLIENALYANVTNRFINGLRHAAKLKEDVGFY